MGKNSLPKYIEGNQDRIVYFDVSSPSYTLDNSSYEHPISSRSYESNPYSAQAIYKPDRLDDKIKPYNSFPSALSDMCPTCQRPLYKDKRIYMDVTRKKAA